VAEMLKANVRKNFPRHPFE